LAILFRSYIVVPDQSHPQRRSRTDNTLRFRFVCNGHGTPARVATATCRTVARARAAHAVALLRSTRITATTDLIACRSGGTQQRADEDRQPERTPDCRTHDLQTRPVRGPQAVFRRARRGPRRYSGGGYQDFVHAEPLSYARSPLGSLHCLRGSRSRA